jgi:DNA-binding transcriptional regulator/RsmH inhibitor MraZ
MFAGEFRAHAEAGGLFRLPPISLAAVLPPEVAVGRQVVVLQSLDQSLWRYQGQSREAKLAATREHLDDGQSRRLMPYVVAESVLAELDPHGRFTIAPGFRTYPAVTTEVVPIGLCDRIALWCPTHWQAYLSGLGERHEIVLGKILDLASHQINVHALGP